MTITRTHHAVGGIALEVVRGPSGANILRDGKSVAHARMRRNVWLITVPGHVWPVTADMPSARFNITNTPCKSFPSRAAALAEVARIIATV
jgi:hypothetical protein